MCVLAGGLPACGPTAGMDASNDVGNLGPGNLNTNNAYSGPTPIGDCNNLPGVCSTALPSIPLTGCSASDYTLPVQVGDQTFQLIFDSGSSTLAVADSTCSTCGVSPAYTPGATATNTGTTTSADYGGGQGWNGTVYRDSVTVANVAAITMAFAAITQQTTQVAGASSFFAPALCTGTPQSNTFQGILGMAGSGAGAPNTNAYAVEMATTTTPAIFSVEMCDLNGYAWFGGYNPDFIATAPQFTPLVSDSTYYEVNIADVQVNGTSLGISTAAVGTTIVDTGTTAFVLPPADFNALIAPIQSDPNFVASFGATFLTDGNCIYEAQGYTATELNAVLPRLSLVFPNVSGGDFTITLPATESYLTPFVVGDHVGYCPGVVAQAPVQGTPAMIVGNGFLHTWVTVFDRQNMQVGFAQEANCVPVGG